jgi:hypothetical protein
MKKLAIIAISVLTLSGCTTSQDYQLYAQTQQKIAQANAMAETARYAALAEIAKTGDPGARVAAVMSLNMGAQNSNSSRQQVEPPRSFGDTALQWTSILLPSLTNIYGINANRQVAITQSNNATSVARSTNDTFATINSNMATSNTAIANSGTTAVTATATNGLASTANVANAGITGVVTTNANGLTAITNVSSAANASIQAISETIPQIQPNITTTTTNNTTTNNNPAP